MITVKDNKLLWIYDGERMQIEAWGKDSVRVRITKMDRFSDEDWALQKPEDIIPVINTFSEQTEEDSKKAEGCVYCRKAQLINGKLRVDVTDRGKLVFTDGQGKVLLGEYEYDGHTNLGLRTRDLAGLTGGLFRASMKWKSDPGEKLYGMGQYQNGIFNLKGSFLELAQRNSQASVPFLYSDLGYGFLWNNPAVGRASFGMNMTEWEASCTRQIDFWITAGDSPAEILSKYMEATGKPPMMPEHGLGFWQCKLRYQTQDELMAVAREYKRRGVPLDVIIADFFHWTLEGTWEFDPEYWPDPAAMVKELEEMGTKLMVSVWPTVSVHAPDYHKMRELGYLVRSEYGVNINMLMIDPTSFTDLTNPDARDYLWNKIKEGYRSYGIENFWLDVAEPEYTTYDFANYRYFKGNNAEVGNEYPAMYAKTFYDGLKADGIEPLSLIRCAWAGSQKYGALVWSGDIASTFESLRIQIVCGLQMAMAGIPWWTTDIGGFYGGDVNDPKFHELLIRWFQYGTFCPVMRLHGNRLPAQPPMSTVGGGRCCSGADNEIWSFGEENCGIMTRHIELRNRLRPYIRAVMQKAADEGCPVMRPLFYNFPADKCVWDIKDQFMLGDDIMTAPVTEYGARSREVYLPEGTKWVDAYTDEVIEGGQTVTADAPIEHMPVYIRAENAALAAFFKA